MFHLKLNKLEKKTECGWIQNSKMEAYMNTTSPWEISTVFDKGETKGLLSQLTTLQTNTYLTHFGVFLHFHPHSLTSLTLVQLTNYCGCCFLLSFFFFFFLFPILCGPFICYFQIVVLSYLSPWLVHGSHLLTIGRKSLK